MKTVAGIEEEQLGLVHLLGKSIKVDQHLEEVPEGQAPATIRAVVPFETKSIDVESRTIEFIGSTASKDRYGDEIVQAGWELGNFLKNPVIPWGHDYSSLPVAKALEVGFKDGNLWFKAQFATADEYPFADTVFKMLKGGYVRAFSVGFIPLEFDGNYQDGYTFTQCELLEVSVVTVPANPEALVLGFNDGTFSDRDRKNLERQVQQLVKSLTLSVSDNDNEDMEQVLSSIKELSDKVDALSAVVKQEEEPATPANEQPEGEAPAAEDIEANAEQEASAGAEGEEAEEVEAAEEVVEEELVDIDPEALKSAVRQGVSEVLDYQLGKIK